MGDNHYPTTYIITIQPTLYRSHAYTLIRQDEVIQSQVFLKCCYKIIISSIEPTQFNHNQAVSL